MAVKKYVVRLSGEEREQLGALLRKGKSPAQRLLKARILLKADVSEAGEGLSDSRIIQALGTSPSTELTLDPPQATSDQAGVPLLDEDYLILSTIHSARVKNGRLCLCSTRRACIPSDISTRTSAEIEEERRLLCVSMTSFISLFRSGSSPMVRMR